MHGLKLSHGLMAGASLAVITLVAVNSGLLREAPTLPSTPSLDQESSTIPEPTTLEKKDEPAKTAARQAAGENEALKDEEIEPAFSAPKVTAESDAVSGYLQKAPSSFAVTVPAV